jgi:transposase, IS6 family
LLVVRSTLCTTKEGDQCYYGASAYIKVKGRWTYPYRAVDKTGQTIDLLLSSKRDTVAAKRFIRKALAQPHTVNPRTITMDKNTCYPKAVANMKRDGQLWRGSKLRQVNICITSSSKIIGASNGWPGQGSALAASGRPLRILAGFEAMAMIGPSDKHQRK